MQYGKTYSETIVNFQIQISSGDQAIMDMPLEEVTGSLLSVVKKLNAGQFEGSILDTNGNRIGSYCLKVPEEEEEDPEDE